MLLEPQDAMGASADEASSTSGFELPFLLSQPQPESPVQTLRPAPAAVLKTITASARPKSLHEPARRRSHRLRIHPAAGLLLGILAVQAYLSLRLVWSNTPYQDEALYLWAGRLEWQHWLDGTPIPALPTYFSGAPVVYPPLSAAAAAIGGLAGARILSLAFILGATSLLWATTTRLIGRRAAFFACAMWAALGPTQRLGAFGTYDAMSLFLLVLAAWCAVRGARQTNSTKWLLAVAAATLIANVAKYASAIFDPVIVALAGLAACPRPGGKEAAARWTVVMTYIVSGVVVLLLLAGHGYSQGFESTTLARSGGQQSALQVLALSWQWIGVVIAAGACGAAFSVLGQGRQLHRTMLLSLLVLAALLVPLEQARIHTTTSLDKHVAFGAWFGAIAVGYAADRLVSLVRWPSGQAMLAGALAMTIAPVAVVGIGQARQFFEWPNATAFIRVFRPLAEYSHGPILVETSAIAQYYLPMVQWQRWSNTFSITTPSGQSRGYGASGISSQGQPAVYLRYIRRRYFDLIALNYSAGQLGLDDQITSLLDHDPSYRDLATARFGHNSYTIWQRVALAMHHQHRHREHKRAVS